MFRFVCDIVFGGVCGCCVFIVLVVVGCDPVLIAAVVWLCLRFVIWWLVFVGVFLFSGLWLFMVCLWLWVFLSLGLGWVFFCYVGVFVGWVAWVVCFGVVCGWVFRACGVGFFGWVFRLFGWVCGVRGGGLWFGWFLFCVLFGCLGF